MKHTISITLCSSLFLFIAAAAAGTVEYALQRLPVHGRPHPVARDDTIESALLTNFDHHTGVAYYLNITVGTPGQLQTVVLDTGSSDLYFTAANATFCQNHPGCVGGTFDPSQSSTFNITTPRGFETEFADHTTGAGDLFTDVVQIGDLLITGVQMGIAYNISSSVGASTGLMGVGYSSNEGLRGDEAPYPNFIESLVGSEAISSRFFSLYLNELDQYGSILFGGIDTDKFEGELTSLNCLPRHKNVVGNFYLFLEDVTAQSYNGHNQTILQSNESDHYIALPDTGATAFYLPSRAYQEVVKLMGVVPHHNTLVRPCSDITRGISNTTHLHFTFAGAGEDTNTASLTVEMADLFTPLTGPDGTLVTDAVGRPYCELQLEEARHGSKKPFTIGDPIMRAGYWTFDLDNGQVSVAQAKLRASSSNVVPIEAGPDGLSDATDLVKIVSQVNNVAGTISTPVSYELSTATSTVGSTTGSQTYPTVASISTHVTTVSASACESEDAAAALKIPEFATSSWIFGALVSFGVAAGAMLI